MIATIPWYDPPLISSWIEICFANVVRKYLNSSTLSNEILSVFIWWLRLAFWSRDTTMYLVLSAFAYSPISLLVTTKDPVIFFCSIYASAQYINIISINQNWCVPFNFKPSRLTWTLLMVYSKAKLKILARDHLLFLNHSYAYSAIRFNQTHFY